MKRVNRGAVAEKPRPWGLIATAVAAALLAAALFGNVYLRSADTQEVDPALAPFTPSEANPDPAKKIPGVIVKDFPNADHVPADERVDYEENPPFGGPHDQSWAACTGVVYEQPIRVENIVHSLEHGAVWVAYHPDRVTGDALHALREMVDGQNYMLMSPVPTLDSPISLQSWGHQLKLSDAQDERIGQFIAALRTNPYTHPEIGATCDELGPGLFDRHDPPPFEAAPRGPRTEPNR